MSPEIAFMIGLATGAAIMAYHRTKISKAVATAKEESRIEKDQMTNELRFVTDQRNELVQQQALSDAYWNGYEKGQQSPLNDAERLVRCFQGRNVQFINTSRNRTEECS